MLGQNILEELKNAVGATNVLTTKEDLISYSFDATAGMSGEMPDVVVVPANTEQVAAVVKIANNHKIPVYPRGSGTNLVGGTIPEKNGIVISLLEMNRILEMDAENLTATVQPGVIIQTLNDAVSEFGLIYPPDPGTVKTATMGGSINECSGGLRGLKYGVTKHYVMGMEVVLANGEIIKIGGKTVKNVTGYDLTRLFVGSEGTLGIITEIIVKLIPAPDHKESMMAVFSNLDDAAKTITEIISNKVIPATLEIMDNVTIRTVENHAKIGLPVDAEAILLIEVDGIKEVVAKEAATVLDICKKNNATVKMAQDDVEREKLWTGRRVALPALAQVRPTTVLEDATVPRNKIPHMIRAIRQIGERYGLTIGTFGHAGDGNLHPTILTDENDHAEMKKVEQAVEEIFKVALELGGTLSGEHGIGIAKAKFMEWEFGPAGMEVLRNVKKAFDPNNILNPGKLIGGGA